MADGNLAYASINRAWEGACKAILGESIGEIGRYEKYLQKMVEPYRVEKSCISGKEVAVTGDYAKGSKFISGDEIGEFSKIPGRKAIGINQAKDIDSVIEAIGETACYSGNDVLGNSSQVANSNRVVDSNYVYKAHDVFYSQYVAQTYLSKYSDYVFGCESVGKGTHFAIKSFETYEDVRLFECVRVYESSDCAYGANLENCRNCVFCFNLRSKSRCIGNLELPKEKYEKLKGKLLGEIREKLQKDRAVPSIVEIIGGI